MQSVGAHRHDARGRERLWFLQAFIFDELADIVLIHRLFQLKLQRRAGGEFDVHHSPFPHLDHKQGHSYPQHDDAEGIEDPRHPHPVDVGL